MVVCPISVTATEEAEKDIAEELESAVDSQLDELDLSQFEAFLSQLSSDGYWLFSDGFAGKVRDIIDGKTDTSEGFLQYILQVLWQELVGFLPAMSVIVGVSILLGVMSNLRPKGQSSIGEIIYLACYGIIIITALSGVYSLVVLCRDVIFSLQSQMNALFPILIGLVAALGGGVSASVYQPSVAFLSGGMIQLIANVVFPMVILTIVFSIVSNLSKDIKMTKMTDFLESTAIWIVSVSFTVFMAFLSVNGITAGVRDGISVRAAKFAISSYVPILGGYLSEGFNIILAGSVLIKNALGLSGILLLLLTIVLPVIKIGLFILGLKLTAAVIEPVTDARIPAFLTALAKNMKLLIVCILGVGFMYFISIMLLILSCNYVI